jgi:transcriptional regulator with XRE-family HTH domain
MDPILEHVGKRIRQARTKLGMTQLELAARLGKRRHEISRYESGKHSLKVQDLPKLAEILQVSVSFFFEDDNEE